MHDTKESHFRLNPRVYEATLQAEIKVEKTVYVIGCEAERAGTHMKQIMSANETGTEERSTRQTSSGFKIDDRRGALDLQSIIKKYEVFKLY